MQTIEIHRDKDDLRVEILLHVQRDDLESSDARRDTSIVLDLVYREDCVEVTGVQAGAADRTLNPLSVSSEKTAWLLAIRDFRRLRQIEPKHLSDAERQKLNRYLDPKFWESLGTTLPMLVIHKTDA